MLEYKSSPPVTDEADHDAYLGRAESVSVKGLDDRARALEEKKLVRKLDNRILPIACLLYLFACRFPFFLKIRIKLINLSAL